MADDVSIIVRVRDYTRAGIDEVSARLNSLVRSANSMDKEFGSMTSAALSLAPALIPIAAATAPIVVTAAAAGVAVAAFGAAVIPQIGAMNDAAKAEDKYEAALDKHGKTSKQAATAEKAYLDSVSKLPPATREAAAALTILKDQYKDWSESLAGDTMPVVTKSLAVFGAIFPKLTPLVKGASVELNRMITLAAGGISATSFDTFMGKFADFANGSLRRVDDGIVHLLRTMNTGAIGGGLSEFMRYAKENGPLVGDTLKNLALALTHLITAGSDVGVSMLQIVNVFARLVAAVPTSLITTLMQVSIAFKAVKLASAGFASIAGGITQLNAQIVAMRTATGAAAAGTSTLAAAWSGLSSGAKMGIVVTGIAILVVALKKLSDIGKEAPPDIEKMTTAIGQLGDTGKVTGEAVRVFGKDMQGLADSLRGLARPGEVDQVQQFMTRLIGMDSTPVKKWKEDIDSVDKALANLVKGGHADLARGAFDQMASVAQKNGLTIQELRGKLDDYKSALADQAFEEQLAAQSMGLFGEQAQQVKAKLDNQKQSADGLRQAIQALNDVNRAGLGGMIGFEAAIDAAAKAAQENGRSLTMVNGQLDLNSEKARGNATALNDLAAKTDAAAGAARDSGQSWSQVNGIYERGRQQLIANAMQMGLNRQQAEALARQILSTPNKTAVLKGNIEDLQAKLNSAKSQLASVPASKRSSLLANIADLERKIASAKSQLNNIDGTTANTYVTTHYRSDGLSFLGASGRFAHGGVVGAAGGGPRSRMTLVGEQGPELVDLAPGSRVRSNPDTARMLGGGGGRGGSLVQLEIKSGGSALDDLLVEILRKAVRVRGGNVQLVLGQG
ncbi:hypothetical protein [Streptomyces violascens]|uniref:Uncharacterized protein n=1 Tax=Streptomyces violascens TaxID=67381 RepID=A0ABQ3QXB8_9ACTN|nr:hypothetical protein [Streptomyces violascens]GGU13310.1 hypothetical protein GCM10010289_38740 [Streptomyces violascens]GHI41924.1 hypothetical protein Sviol_63320 [Streptomyces violascens]